MPSMLKSLRHIVQNVNSATSLETALRIIVANIHEVTGADVCSVYLADSEARQYVLMATDGLQPDAVGCVRLGFGEGLVGLAAEQAKPLNLAHAQDHPRFKFVPNCGEEPYQAYLGVPVIHQREVLGVLVVQQRVVRRFDESAVTFLVTLAAQLAGTIAYAKATGGIFGPAQASDTVNRYIDGIASAPGVAIGVAVSVYLSTDLTAVPDRTPQDSAAEEAAFRAAVAAVSREMKTLGVRLDKTMPAEDRALFDAYAMLVESSSLIDAVSARIRAGNWAPGALRETIQAYAQHFETLDDPYLRDRANDIRDVGRRILMHLQEEVSSARDYRQNTILVGDQVSAIDVAEVPAGRLAGIVSGHGTASSHVAILAHGLGVPAAMGIGDFPLARLHGQALVVDGYRGRVYIQPSASIVHEFTRLARDEKKWSEELKRLHDLPAETPDGVRIPLYTNTGLFADIARSLDVGADGVGIYRTEFPFMIRERFPSEEEQLDIYRHILEAFAPQPVTLRTLDVGGDKPLPYFPVQEPNPFLGWRGIRMMLDHPEIFLTQIRAALRASVGLGNLNLLLPMISGVAEVDEALGLIQQTYRELIEEGVAITRPRLGVMIEVPSAVYQAEALARRVDFLSVGTNDLTQYLLAVDRNNARVAKLFDPLHPAVLRALVDVVAAGHRVGKPVSVCGETAGDPAVAVLLLGMGVDSLSIGAGDVPRIKWAIRSVRRDRARELLALALRHEEPQPIRKLLNEALEDAGLGGLVRVGK